GVVGAARRAGRLARTWAGAAPWGRARRPTRPPHGRRGARRRRAGRPPRRWERSYPDPATHGRQGPVSRRPVRRWSRDLVAWVHPGVSRVTPLTLNVSG